MIINLIIIDIFGNFFQKVKREI